MPTVPTKIPKILAAKRVKRVAKAISAERGKTVTLVCCMMNACGNFVPPAFIFPIVRMRPEFLDDAPPESLGLANKKGWMNQELFVQYLNHFVKHTRPTENDPVLLIVDDHSSRMSLEAVEFCRKHHVVNIIIHYNRLSSYPTHCFKGDVCVSVVDSCLTKGFSTKF